MASGRVHGLTDPNARLFGSVKSLKAVPTAPEVWHGLLGGLELQAEPGSSPSHYHVTLVTPRLGVEGALEAAPLYGKPDL